MDIKGVFRNVIPFAGRAEEAKAKTKADADNDREGNGQAADDGEHGKRRDPTPEEVIEAIKYLESLPGVKDNGLTVRAATADGVSVLYIEDRAGKTIRRIPQSEIVQLLASRQKKTGNLLNKTMQTSAA